MTRIRSNCHRAQVVVTDDEQGKSFLACEVCQKPCLAIRFEKRIVAGDWVSFDFGACHEVAWSIRRKEARLAFGVGTIVQFAGERPIVCATFTEPTTYCRLVRKADW
jgi:hypothetical protein